MMIGIKLRRTLAGDPSASAYRPRAARLAIANLIGCALILAAPAHAQTLAGALESALKLNPLAQSVTARRAAIDAQRLGVDAPTPAPPTVIISHSTDLVERNDGRREWEAGVEVPLWSARERSARRGLIELQLAEIDSQMQVLRWELCADVRERAWQVLVGAMREQRSQQRVAAALGLEQDVERRMQAGELARADLLMARAETLQAQAELNDSRLAHGEATQAFRILTGIEPARSYARENEGALPDIDQHPRLAALRKRIEVAQGKSRLARAQDGNPIEIGLLAKSEREAFGASYRHAFKVELRIPLAAGVRNEGRIMAAESDLAHSLAEYAAVRARLLAEIERARTLLSLTRNQLVTAQRQVSVARDSLSLMEKAFTLGERGVTELLRARAAARDVANAEAALRIEIDRATSRLNQALGVLP